MPTLRLAVLAVALLALSTVTAAAQTPVTVLPPGALSLLTIHADLSVQGSVDRFVVIPAAPQSLLDASAAEADRVSSVSNGNAPTLKRDQFGAAPIPGLRGRVRPATVAGLVTAFVVDAIKRQAIRARPHVGEERFEVDAPSLAHRYPAPSIHRVVSVPGIHASAPREVPSSPFLTMRSHKGIDLSVISAVLWGLLPPHASTTSAATIRQKAPVNYVCRAAIALTGPSSVDAFDSHKSSVPHSPAIHEGGHV
jgi:hypothetical protein